MTMPDDAGTPWRTVPAAGGGAGAAVVGGGGGAGAAAPSSSPNPASASSRSAASASAAWAPLARATIVSPWRTASMMSALRLRASAGPRPVVSSATETAASKRLTVSTTRAAGRACSPSRLGTSSRSSAPPSAIAAGSGAGRRLHPRAARPSCPSAARASPATSSSDAPVRARAAAATAPSTIGASHSRTRTSSTISAAISALITALPRSIRTSTPSSLRAASIADSTSAMSVPISPGGSAIPPAGSITTSSPPIWRASSTTPAASVALCETMTSPTTP